MGSSHLMLYKQLMIFLKQASDGYYEIINFVNDH